MNKSKQIRVIALIAIAKEFGDALAKRLNTERDGMTPSCLSCLHFDEGKELCKLVNQRPPARVIALACAKYDDSDDIPF